MKKVLGLDLGVTSVGWALVEKGTEDTGSLLDGGVRIFTSVTEDKTSNLKNQKRREKRGQRVNIQRRSKRKTALKNALVKAHLLPAAVLDPTKAPDLLNQISTDPYGLRAKALRTPLTDYELGRTFLCLGMRRGFLSNRKSGADSDSKKVQPAIDSLQKEISNNKCRTLGEYLSKQPTQRGRYTHRSMFIDEFHTIWNQQSKTSARLNDSLKAQLEQFIFFQNPLKIQKYLVGACSLEPNKRRAAKWQPAAQLLRNWQDVSRIKITHSGKPLDWQEQKKLVDCLQEKKTLKWNSVRKLLGYDSDTKFNLEESGSLKELKGNETQINLNKALGKLCKELDEAAKEKILNWLDTSDNNEKLTEKLKQGFNFEQSVIDALCKCSLPSGYFNLSVKACTKLVEVFETQQEPLSYREAGERAGYVMDELGHVGKGLDKLPAPPQIRNPVVEKALVELRKVVNGVIRKHGKPDAIHLEVARDLKNPKRVRDEIQKRNKQQEKKRGEVIDTLKNDFPLFANVEPKRSDIEKYLLWKECFEDGNGQCPYTGSIISGDMLFTQGIQVEHIIPFSRCFNNSFNNKTLCVIDENARKGNKTPYELYKGTEQYEDVLARIVKLPYPKRQRFKLKEVPQNPEAQRTLNDTRYICKESKRYLQRLGVRVQASTGQFTAVLRRNWNLNGLLNEDGANTKNREDHRHHFIDAAVIANINAGMVQLISKFSSDERLQRSLQAGVYSLKSVFKEPWTGFSLDVEAHIKKIVVSHSPTRKVSGGLHEDTALGLVKVETGTAFATRIELNKDFSSKKLKTIADQKVRELVTKRLEQFENDPKKAFADLDSKPLFHVDGKTPIKSVRVHSNDSIEGLAGIKQNGKVYAYYRKGNNYKICFYEMPDGKWKGHYLTAFDVKSKNTEPPKSFKAGKLIMELCKNDMVELDWKGTRERFRLQKMSAPIDQLDFRTHFTSQKAQSERITLKQATTNSLKLLNPEKIEVTPIGEVIYVSRSNR
ncbi:type II CRISPR RNA-guided endonuclease Cas9 [Verrucomicrobia bacterium]|nr:type II CRISPR RNA-guided endonuclease Cas9 [Verrucomicrobiota bacterium]